VPGRPGTESDGGDAGMVRRILLALLVVILSAGFCFAETKTITAASDPWPPFMDPNSPTQGLAMEIVRAAFATQGYEVTMEFMPWARAEDKVKEGEIDILPNTWTTDKRKEYLLFSDPYATNDVKFIKRKGDPFEYDGLDSLAGKTVGIVRGYGYPEEFIKSDGFKRDEATESLTNVKKLVVGRIDLTLEDRIVLIDLLKKKEPKFLEEVEFTKNALTSQTLSVTCGLKNPRCHEIIEAFNKGLAEIKANGKFDEIMKKYGLN